MSLERKNQQLVLEKRVSSQFDHPFRWSTLQSVNSAFWESLCGTKPEPGLFCIDRSASDRTPTALFPQAAGRHPILRDIEIRTLRPAFFVPGWDGTDMEEGVREEHTIGPSRESKTL